MRERILCYFLVDFSRFVLACDSVIVTGIPIRGQANVADCPKGSFFSVLKGNAKRNVVFPEYNDLFDMPDLYVQPDCSYKVRVFANPRSKYVLNAPEVSSLYRVQV